MDSLRNVENNQVQVNREIKKEMLRQSATGSLYSRNNIELSFMDKSIALDKSRGPLSPNQQECLHFLKMKSEMVSTFKPISIILEEIIQEFGFAQQALQISDTEVSTIKRELEGQLHR